MQQSPQLCTWYSMLLLLPSLLPIITYQFKGQGSTRLGVHVCEKQVLNKMISDIDRSSSRVKIIWGGHKVGEKIPRVFQVFFQSHN